MGDHGGQAKVKMSGYLYKKCKKRMISSWKMYWFVLEDRLLLYYRSKDEYQAISPCKGSINLGPPCSVKSFPSVVNAFQIVTRTNTVTLRAENTEDQMKWMQTIMSALNQNQNFTTESPKRLSHFRYSLDDIVPEKEPSDNQVLKKMVLERQNTMPDRLKTESDNKEIIQRLQKIGAQSYGGSLGAISKIATKKLKSPNLSINRGSQASLQEQNEANGDGEKIVPVLRPLRSLQENLYERISGDSTGSQGPNRASFMVDNDNYSVPLRKSLQRAASEGARDAASFLVENDQYCRLQRPSKELRDSNSVDHYSRPQSRLVENDQYSTTQFYSKEESIYAEPKVNSVIDHNKNSVLVENTFYATTSRSTASENVYEDLDKNLYSEPILTNEELSSPSSPEVIVKGKNRMIYKESSKEEQDKKKKSVKKSKSFIKRVWKKRSKKLERQQKQEDDEEEIYEEVDPKTVEKLDYSGDNAVQMLSELQNILEHKKSVLKATASNNSSKSEDKADEEKTNKASTTTESEPCPSLPPKTQKLPKPTDHERLRSLDEILEDLDKEKHESKSKVKRLIERFSEPESDDVVLRKHDEKVDFKINQQRHSDDLNKLLDELAKVTSAPIMTPGVTSSLVNPTLPEEEWLKLLPRRQRRLSEPDYDVPRPHKSIQLPAKCDNSDKIPATRFFGPVLPPTIDDNSPPKEESFYPSMAPDSLEVEEPKSPTHQSYTSHNYYQKNELVDSKCFSADLTKQNDKIIYAMPKSYLSVATHIVNTCQNICSAHLAEECTIIYKNVKNVDMPEEIFKDSLELCNESSTEF